MEDGINIFYPDKHNVMGKMYITNEEIIIYKRSVATLLGLRTVGVLLDGNKPILRINIADIIEGKKERFRLNKNAFYLTLKDGNTYICCFDKPKITIPYLEGLIKSNMQNN